MTILSVPVDSLEDIDGGGEAVEDGDLFRVSRFEAVRRAALTESQSRRARLREDASDESRIEEYRSGNTNRRDRTRRLDRLDDGNARRAIDPRATRRVVALRRGVSPRRMSDVESS